MSLIKTPSGLTAYSGIRRMKYSSYYKCTFTNGKTLDCSPNHPFMTYDGIVLAKDLTRRSEIYSDIGGVFLKNKRLINDEIWLYDALKTHNNVYYTNGVLSHNCDFLGSANTLISSAKLSTMAWQDPAEKIGDLHIYEKPKDKHIYVMAVDTAEGQNLDHSAFVVVDCMSVPYKVVAKYYNSQITPMLFPNLIYNVARKYNDAHILIETNSIGGQVAQTLHDDLEYESIFSTTNMGRGGQKLSSGFKQNSKLGVKTTIQIKTIGCSNLKGLLENDKIAITDFDIICELTSYVATHSSFAAEPGCHDDLVACLVIFSWLTSQQLFKEITDTDVRKKLYEEKSVNMEEQLLPFGFIEDGSSTKTFKDVDGTVWEHIDSPFGSDDLYRGTGFDSDFDEDF